MLALPLIFRLFWIKNPYLNQATEKKILAKFSYPKKSRNQKFQTPKNRSSPSFKMWSTPWGTGLLVGTLNSTLPPGPFPLFSLIKPQYEHAKNSRLISSHFHRTISWKKLIKDQSIFPLVIIYSWQFSYPFLLIL